MANQASVCSAAAAAIQFFAVIATSVTVAERSNFTMELGGTIGDLVPAAKPTYPRQLPAREGASICPAAELVSDPREAVCREWSSAGMKSEVARAFRGVERSLDSSRRRVAGWLGTEVLSRPRFHVHLVSCHLTARWCRCRARFADPARRGVVSNAPRRRRVISPGCVGSNGSTSKSNGRHGDNRIGLLHWFPLNLSKGP